MIEVLFSEGEAGSMKLAKQSNFLPGKIEEVICLDFMLDIGDIRKSIDSQYRKDLICSMYFQGQYGDIGHEEVGDIYVQELLRLKKYLDNGKNIRIWYSHAPYSICGFYHLCKLLEKYNHTIHVIKLPDYRIEKKGIVRFQNWGEMIAKEFVNHLMFEKELTKQEIQLYSYLWNELVEDNSPMRALVNGQVIGVQEDFYDHLMWKHLSQTPIVQARFIGTLLNNYQISVPDWWYAKRIDDYIEKGKIKIVKNSKDKYKRIISL